MSDSRLRARALLDGWYEVVLVVLVVVALVGAWFSVGAYAAPGTHTVQQSVDQWRITGSFDDQATVRHAGNTTAFRDGEVVHDRAVYLTAVMPVLDGRFHLSYTGSNVPLDVSVRRRIVLQSVSASGRNQTTYWQVNESLGTSNATLAPGGSTTIPFSLNVTRSAQRAQHISQQLGAPGRVQTRVTVLVNASRSVDGATIHHVTFTLPVSMQSGTYSTRSQPGGQTFSRTQAVQVPNATGPVKAVGGPLLLLAGLAGALALLWTRWRGALALTDAERAWLGYRDDRSDFEEWVTAIRLPEEASELPVAEAESLGDLVDFAIDTDNAVLESPEGVFQVVHDGYRYRYEAPPAPEGERRDADGRGAATAGFEQADGAAADSADE